MALKRKLTQEDLRKAMTEHKKKIGIAKKIESPLAKYSESGQLTCVLCKTVVKNETVWPVHLNSKVHKENIALAKRTKLEVDNTSKTADIVFKRPLSPSKDVVAPKKIKGILKNTKSPQVPSLPEDFFDSTSKDLANTDKNNDNTTEIISEGNIPNKVINDEKEKERHLEKERERTRNAQQASLPEGFFDDPVMDAKVRNVEYKNPIEEEWEKFQREIKEQTAQSAQIIADDQEEATTERQLAEIEEQMRHWSRVMDLVKRKEEVQATDRKQENMDEDLSSGDEADFDEFLDWRAKTSYK